MLLELRVKNFRSIKNEQTLSLIATAAGEHADTNVAPILADKHRVIKTAAIYGPNASGKTNLIKAMAAMETIVMTSAQEKQRGDSLPIEPYLFDRTSRGQPSEFEVVISIDEVQYQYGFSATSEKVYEEWLYAFPNDKKQVWFHRKFKEDKKKYSWVRSDFLIGRKKVWQEATRPNALFLSTAIQLNNEQLKPIFDWFKRTLRTVGINQLTASYTAGQCLKDMKGRVIAFMKEADFAIDDVVIEKKQFPIQKLYESVPELAGSKLATELQDVSIYDIKTVHSMPNGERVEMDLDNESDGTKKFFYFAGPWINALENGFVVFVDELHDNFHPHLVKFLVQLFHSKKTNPKNAQLIFTTHETSILSQEIFRRDQIFFTERNDENSTNIYPLTDFSPRKSVENLEKNYLDGRYGALPYFKSISDAL